MVPLLKIPLVSPARSTGQPNIGQSALPVCRHSQGVWIRTAVPNPWPARSKKMALNLSKNFFMYIKIDKFDRIKHNYFL
jgi:hypothetical protein